MTSIKLQIISSNVDGIYFRIYSQYYYYLHKDSVLQRLVLNDGIVTGIENCLHTLESMLTKEEYMVIESEMYKNVS